jgi:hypothetical protein
MMEYKTYLKVDDDEITPIQALEEIRDIDGVEIEVSM